MKYYISAVVLALAIIVTGFLVGRAYNYKFKSKNTVSVLGSSEHNFTADLIVWSATYTRTSPDLKDAYSTLKNDEKMVREYMAKHQIADKEMIVSAIVIDKQYNTSYDQNGRQTGAVFSGYQLRQTLKVESKSIDKVEKVSREITELLQSGIELSSQEPLYYYTKLSDLKVSLLAKASADAYTRASTIAGNANSTLGRLRKATMGVFQITGQYSNEDYSYGGTFNTISKKKTASITVRLEYELE